MTSDKWILSAVQGCEIEFDEIPYQNSVPKEIQFSETERQIIDNELDKLLTKRVVCKSREENGDYSLISSFGLKKMALTDSF